MNLYGSNGYFSLGFSSENPPVLYIPLDSRISRTVLTTVFIVLNFLIGLIGLYYLKRRNQEWLLRKGRYRAVPLHHLSPWLSAPSVATYVWDTHRIPGGKYGFLMLSTGIFSITHQYFVSNFVTSASVPGRCQFEEGVVVQKPFNGLLIPEPWWTTADLALSAQLASINNHGEMGVYKKIPSLSGTVDPNFIAMTSIGNDIIGQWSCTANPISTYDSTLTVDKIIKDLQANNLLYNNIEPSNLVPEYDINNNRFDNSSQTSVAFFSWTASSWTTNSFQPQAWNVQASVSLDLTKSPITVNNYRCSMPDSPASWVLKNTNSTWALESWIERAFVRLYGEFEAQSQTLELVLNSLITAAGSGNVDFWGNSTLEKKNGFSTTTVQESNDYYSHTTSQSDYGCIVAGTSISIEVWIFLGVQVLIIFILLLMDLVMLIISCSRPNRKLVADVPNSLLSWQVAMLRQIDHDQGRKIEAKNTKDWEFGWLPDATGEQSNMLGFYRKTQREHHQDDVQYEALPSIEASKGSLSKMEVDQEAV